MQGIQNLAHRQSSGIYVSLDFDFDAEQALVTVKSQTEEFTLYPHNPQALDCYRHPYAYASSALMSGRMERVAA